MVVNIYMHTYIGTLYLVPASKYWYERIVSNLKRMLCNGIKKVKIKFQQMESICWN